ncbi:carboxymuconolactone decarboxylase family protein [Undibacterium rugosum]|uniref:Carboxymuconolactone decarboxylase family protein n=1 Tax=Undibacterium rugosum TaxID=2762291 RepID=A0A923I2R8_9BURK|nr:carboxymuconolactone decarboxylase family protein [Undibacterium rugosum]MBC3935427.1 carboxymuconolactone decarboxylase family protein [Undibacterium rugosum]MBR7778798.1 carboxymuconolactone decarboxylase family protein [Undibacterium rugosum]
MTILSASSQTITWDTFSNTAPGVVHALSLLGKAIDDSGLEKPLIELIKLRASQLNGCAFCLQYHLNLARKIGIDAVKTDLLATWRDAGVFTSRERAALAWTEALTNMTQHPVSDSVYVQLQAEFTATEITFLTSAVAAINAWNRIAGALKFAPPFE